MTLTNILDQAKAVSAKDYSMYGHGILKYCANARNKLCIWFCRKDTHLSLHWYFLSEVTTA